MIDWDKVISIHCENGDGIYKFEEWIEVKNGQLIRKQTCPAIKWPHEWPFVKIPRGTS